MDSLSTHVFPISGSGGWGVRVKTGLGLAVEYHYGTETQARFMAAVLALQPARLPPAQKLVAHLKGRRNQAKRVEELQGVTSEEIDGALEGLAVGEGIEHALQAYAEGESVEGLEEAFAEYDFEDDGLGIEIEVEVDEPAYVTV